MYEHIFFFIIYYRNHKRGDLCLVAIINENIKFIHKTIKLIWRLKGKIISSIKLLNAHYLFIKNVYSCKNGDAERRDGD